MAQRVAAVSQSYSSSAPTQVESFDRTYLVGNGSLRLFINKIRQGYSDVLYMYISDNVAEKGGAGFAKFTLTVTKPHKGKSGWLLTSNFGGNLLSKGMRSAHVTPDVREMLFYGDRNKLRGCFILDKCKDGASGDTFCRARLLFGFQRRAEVHALTVKIVRNEISLVFNIDEPTIATHDQLQPVQSAFSQLQSNVADDDYDPEDDQEEPRKEYGHAWDVMGQIKNGGSASGIGNGSVWYVNIQKIEK